WRVNHGARGASVRSLEREQQPEPYAQSRLTVNDVWKLSHPQFVRTYLSEERRDTVNRTRLTRAPEHSGALSTRQGNTPE
ncbi:MAG: hypothetical protein ACK56U_16670, partial [Planctomyces sp.]